MSFLPCTLVCRLVVLFDREFAAPNGNFFGCTEYVLY
ncbi:hypothetical protein Ptr902_04358 [Pyrenophora tritici-repentis]|nr:hypothetical protein TUN205_10683 [Pyrenophora tritici-repentis]KAI0617318.1 hypothetical protein TUN199_10694 [Pyrenophora tritici-repentis]KAI2485418.1 hypothetical protein Ptr902_04358 [Pyrenophora tritici-repentis]